MTSQHQFAIDEIVLAFETISAEGQMLKYRKWLDGEILQAFSINHRQRGDGGQKLRAFGA